MFRFRTPGVIAAGGLVLLAGCKHHHKHQHPVADVPMVHAPLIHDGGTLMHNPAGSPPAGTLVGPVPRPYLPPADPSPAGTPGAVNPAPVLPAPAEAPKIPPAITQSFPAKPDGAAVGFLPPGGPVAVVIPPVKQPEPTSVSPPAGPTLTGLPASSTPDPFVAAPNRVFAPVTTTDVVTAPKDTTPELQPMKLKPGERFGHSPDYRWVAGVLDKHQRGGYWTLRYADFAADDAWGGKVRLIDDPRLTGFRSGDYVYLEGDLLAPANGSGDVTGYPPYRINQIRPVGKGR